MSFSNYTGCSCVLSILMDSDRYKFNRVIRNDNFWKCMLICERWWISETRKIHTHIPEKYKCEVEVFPWRFTKPNVSGYIRLAPVRGLLCEPCQEGPADQMILPGTEETKMKLLFLSTAWPIWSLTFPYQRSASVFQSQALGYCSTTVSVIWQHHNMSLIAGCKTGIWPPFLTPYCSRQASISSGAWTCFSVEMPKIWRSNPVQSQSKGSARKHSLEVIR